MIKRLFLIIILAPIFLLSFVVIHEVGHTFLARLFGDSNSTFYLAKIDPDGQGMCLGCNITDHTKLTKGENLIVSLGGLIFTQMVALAAFLAAFKLRSQKLWRRRLVWIGVSFAFLDVIVQVSQGLLYDWGANEWPTNVDLMDTMKLVVEFTGLGQPLLKVILFVVAVAYLGLILFLRRKVMNKDSDV